MSESVKQYTVLPCRFNYLVNFRIWFDVCANSTQAGSSKSAESREDVGSTIVKVEAMATLTYSSLVRATFQLAEVTLAEESDINK